MKTTTQVLLKTAMMEINAKFETKTCMICAFSVGGNQTLCNNTRGKKLGEVKLGNTINHPYNYLYQCF